MKGTLPTLNFTYFGVNIGVQEKCWAPHKVGMLCWCQGT